MAESGGPSDIHWVFRIRSRDGTDTVPGHTSPTGKRVSRVNNMNTLYSPMPTQRKTSRHELTPIERAYLLGRRDAGESFGQISCETGVPKTTVVNTVHNAKE